MNAQKTLLEAEDRAEDLQEKIIASVAGFYKIDTPEIRRRTCKASVAVPRQIVVYLFRNVMGLSHPFDLPTERLTDIGYIKIISVWLSFTAASRLAKIIQQEWKRVV
jgi:hypothetical protein